jgi:hypothetical protein
MPMSRDRAWSQTRQIRGAPKSGGAASGEPVGAPESAPESLVLAVAARFR